MTYHTAVRISRLFLVLTMLSSFLLAGDKWSVRQDGIGPIKIDMTLPQINSTLHEEFRMPNNKEDRGCFYVNPTQHPHVSLMIENGRLVRIDVDNAGIATAQGVQVGDSEKHALQVYGTDVKVEEHHYNPEGHYLTIKSNDGRYGIRFETDKGKVESFYAGTWEAIQYVEGCQ